VSAIDVFAYTSAVLLPLVMITTWYRDRQQRRLATNLVRLMHKRGYHDAAHMVRWAFLVGVFPSAENLQDEREGQ
jgi:hypothetical protein